MELVLKYRNEIYGFLAFWILFFHVSVRVGMAEIPFLTNFVRMGNFAVDIFLFLSGFCLCLSLKRDSDVKRFYIRRFKRVVITYLIIATPFFIWKSIEEVTDHQFFYFFYDLSGLSFWFSGVQNAWFVEAILIFYIITPLVFYIVKKGKKYSSALLVLLYAILVIVHFKIPFVHRCEIALTRLPIFIIGIVMAYYWPDFEFKHKKIALLVFLVEALIALYIGRGSFGGFWYWFFCALMVLPALWLLRSIFSITTETVRVFFSKLGAVSLEIYLIHIMTLHIFTFYDWISTVGRWMYLILPAITLPLSFIVPKIAKVISRNERYPNLIHN